MLVLPQKNCCCFRFPFPKLDSENPKRSDIIKVYFNCITFNSSCDKASNFGILLRGSIYFSVWRFNILYKKVYICIFGDDLYTIVSELSNSILVITEMCILYEVSTVLTGPFNISITTYGFLGSLLTNALSMWTSWVGPGVE